MIRKAIVEDAYDIARMAVKMWDSHTTQELASDFENLISRNECAVFLYSADSVLAGFAQCQLRHDYVEGTESSPVGYLEGIFVEESYRNRGVARELLIACEGWARDMGCREFASDCEFENDESLAFHMKMGFVEANRIICFTKEL